MSEKNNIFYKFISNSYIYLLIQKIMSATKVREEFICKFVKNKKNLSVLDIGCGPANILKKFSSINYYGYDIDINHINFAKKKFSSKNFHFFNRMFGEKEVFNLPKFDFVLLLGVIHHLDNNKVKKNLITIKKVLKKNGKLLILDNVLTQNQNSIAKYLIKKDKGKNIRNLDKYKLFLQKDYLIKNIRISHQKFVPYTWLTICCKKK
jgi:SAM-dependent methyltransferase